MADLRVMLPLAAALINKVLQSGEYKHGNVWETQLISHHIEHAIGHLRAFENGEVFDGLTDETHLSHMVTRLLMAVELQQREIEAEKRIKRRAEIKARQAALQTG